MRRGIAPGRLDQRFRAQQQPAGLWSSEIFPAAVNREIGAAREVWDRPLQLLGGSIHHHGNAARPRRRHQFLEAHLRARLLISEHRDHRDGLGECHVELGAAADLDDMCARHADRLVVGQAQHLHGIVAGDAGGGGKRHSGGAAAGDHAPFRLRQLREPLARGFHELVKMDELSRCLGHGVLDLRQHEAAAVQCAHRAAIDDGTHAEREIGIGIPGHRRHRSMLRAP